MNPEENFEPTPETAPKKTVITVLAIVIGLLVISNLATLVVLLYLTLSPAKVVEQIVPEQPAVVPIEQVVPQEPVAPAVVRTDDDLYVKFPAGQKTSSITVNWPQAIPEFESVEKMPDFANLKLFADCGLYQLVKTGIVADGIYKDKELYNFAFSCGMGGPLVRAVKDDDNYIILQKESDPVSGGSNDGTNATLDPAFKIDQLTTISNLNSPETILIPNSTRKLVLVVNDVFQYVGFSENVKKFNFTTIDKKNIDVYLDNSCFYTLAPDGTKRRYDMPLEFLAKPTLNDYTSYRNPRVLNFTFTNGQKNKNEYSSAGGGGCMGGECLKMVDYVTDTDLVVVGKTAAGESIYTLKDQGLMGDFYNNENTVEILKFIYDKEYYVPEGSVKPSYEDYLKSYPLLYWKSPVGTYVEFLNAKYMLMAECGKPVIYLYPEKEMNVDVKVTPAGGLTYTEPVYGQGWSVSAKPTGELFNYSDKQTYPYLFWEGNALDYVRPNQGFVVAKDEIKSFLVKALTKQGLVEKEYNEFIEFWLPQMQEKPYYFITFVPQSQFDKMAPLSVNPQPTTVIRVFMDFQGLDQPERVQPQKLSAPERKGFTVVEWGRFAQIKYL